MPETAMSPTTPSRPDIPPPVREKEVETPVELPDPNREAPKPDEGDLHDEDSARETKG
jgi:hypothetical protein